MTDRTTQVLRNTFLVIPQTTGRANWPRTGGGFDLASFGDPLAVAMKRLASLQERVAELEAYIRTSSGTPPARGWSSAIASLDDPRFELRLPLPVGLEEKDDTVVAYSPDFESYGSGETEFEALDDLRKAIIDDFDLLLEESDHLGPLPARILGRMSSLIRRVQ